MKLLGVEGLRQIVEKAAGIFRRRSHERMADDHAELAVDAPVDEEAEALIAEPFEALGLVERADFGIVVSNNRYTDSAEQLAATNRILLLHYRDLQNLDEILRRQS